MGRRRRTYYEYARWWLGADRLPAGVPAALDEVYRRDRANGDEPDPRVIAATLRPWRKPYRGL